MQGTAWHRYLLSWAGQRAPIYPSYATGRSLKYLVVPTLASSFLASFEDLRKDEKVLLLRDRAVRKTRRHQKVNACFAGRAGRPGDPGEPGLMS